LIVDGREEKPFLIVGQNLIIKRQNGYVNQLILPTTQALRTLANAKMEEII